MFALNEFCLHTVVTLRGNTDILIYISKYLYISVTTLRFGIERLVLHLFRVLCLCPIELETKYNTTKAHHIDQNYSAWKVSRYLHVWEC
jgi:hypothetical protein